MSVAARPAGAGPGAAVESQPPSAEVGTGTSGVFLDVLDADGYRAAIPGLADLLVDAVDGGAALGFLAGLDPTRAAAWWTDRLPDVEAGTIRPIAARTIDGRIVGCAMLVLARNDNAPHRAEVAKVLVDRSVRHRGIGRALMVHVEAAARSAGRWLLFLDTQTGSPAERLYRSLGWTEAGSIPFHHLHPTGELRPTTFFWKDLRSPEERHQGDAG